LKTIEINISDISSIEDALAKVRNYRDKLKQRSILNEIMEELATMGMEIVDYSYAGASEEDYYEVSIKKSGKSYLVVAQGDTVMFIEFGTGVMTAEWEASVLDSEWVSQFVQPGMWSQTEGAKHFIPGKHEYWYYEGHKYTGTPATNGMYHASKYMQQEVEQVVRKALSKL